MIITFQNSLRQYECLLSHSGGGASVLSTSMSYLIDKDVNVACRIKFTHASGAYSIIRAFPSEYAFTLGKTVVIALLNHTIPANASVSFQLFNGATPVLTTGWKTVVPPPNDVILPLFIEVIRNAPLFNEVQVRIRPLSTVTYDIGEVFVAKGVAPADGGPDLSSFRITIKDPSDKIELEDGSLAFYEKRRRREIAFSITNMTQNEASSLTTDSATLLNLNCGRRHPIMVLPFVQSVPSDAGELYKMQIMAIYGLLSQAGSIVQITNNAGQKIYTWKDVVVAETS